MRKTSKVITAAAACVALSSSGFAGTQSEPIPPLTLSSLHGLRFLPKDRPHSITALPLNSPPIGGYAPRVVLGLTNEQAPGDVSFAAIASSNPAGITLPSGGAPRYFLATFDTGAQSHIVRYNDAEIFDLGSVDRLGNYTQEISGASGVEDSDITDGLGIYMTGLGNASVAGGSTINVAPGSLRGQWNTSILTTLPGSVLPNIIGTPMIAQYQAAIRVTQPRQLTVGGQTVRSPDVSFQALNTAMPAGYSRLSLEVLSGNGVSPSATYFPSLDNFNNWADNPIAPTFWASLFAHVNGSHTAGSINSEQFLFDTGAEVTVLSEDSAAAVGFYTGGPNPSTPDFFVEVQGVGGTTIDVPGFYMNTLSITTNGGPITWHDVPVLVLNLPDPRDFIGFVPGILGTNLFTDRDMVVNGGTSNPFVGISPQWEWAVNGAGNWSDSSKWTLAVPNAVDAQANFYGKITSPQTVAVDGAGFSVGTMSFDNANRYTIAGPGRVTFAAALDDAQINVYSGSHTISAPVTFASSTTFDVKQVASTLTISSDVTATGVGIAKTGPGVLEMKNVRAASLNVSAGKLTVLSNGTNAATSKVGSLTINTSAGTTARIDLKNNAMIVDYDGVSPVATIKQYLVNGYAGGGWNGAGGIGSSIANSTTHAIGYVDTASLPLGGTFAGQSIDGSAVAIAYARYGDTDLNGVVNTTDFTRLASNFGTSGKFWWQGDFNFDGLVNVSDFSLLAGNFGLSATGLNGEPTPQDWAALAAAVPEPVVALPAAALLMLSHRRRRSR